MMLTAEDSVNTVGSGSNLRYVPLEPLLPVTALANEMKFGNWQLAMKSSIQVGI